MRYTLLFLLSILTVAASAQDKISVNYNRLTELKGTTYVLATVETYGKLFGGSSSDLLFINTLSGETKKIDFADDAYIEKVEQVRIDSLGINKIVVTANTVNLNNNKGIDWRDPTQVIVLSTDGKEKTQLTDDKFFTTYWTINYQTGAIVISGHYDTNNNGKYDRSDKNEMVVYDLKTLKLVVKI